MTKDIRPYQKADESDVDAIDSTSIIFPVPIVSAIIERERAGETEVLVQTRFEL